MNIGDTVSKSNYTKYAIWCNSNNAHIEIKDGAYVVVENETTTETTADKIAELKAQYEYDKAELMNYYIIALIDDDTDTMADIKTELEELAAEFDSNIAELEAE